PEHLSKWWGPKGWTLPVCEVDFRPGGVWLYCMRGPDGTEGWGRATYQEIVPPERIVYVDAFADAEGNVLEGMPQMVITVEFVDLGGKTKLIATTEFATVEDLEKTMAMGMAEGFGETLDRLEAHLAEQQAAGETSSSGGKSTLTLPSEREIRMSRVFNAPRELIFRALTDPQLAGQWWGQRNSTTHVDKM